MANQREQTKLLAFFGVMGVDDLTFTDRKGYDSIDAFVTISGRSYCVEAKVRNCSMSAYPTHILEAAKLTQFKALAAEGYRGLFILFFTDGILVYNIAERLRLDRAGEHSQLQMHQKSNLPTHTMKQRGRTTKSVAYLSQSPVFKDRSCSLHF